MGVTERMAHQAGNLAVDEARRDGQIVGGSGEGGVGAGMQGGVEHGYVADALRLKR